MIWYMSHRSVEPASQDEEENPAGHQAQDDKPTYTLHSSISHVRLKCTDMAADVSAKVPEHKGSVSKIGMGHSRVVAVDVQGEAEAVVHGWLDDILKHAWQAVARAHDTCSRIVFSPMKSPAGKTSIETYQQNAHSLTEQTVLQPCNEMQVGALT